ncbi:hypothetical protein HMN09_00994400 [Mycena chlorophos]|uniref:F-box domain-containing protein n=1 Tax=Mycena chlorophos TaxID=658473 RepID=A0A8H6SJ14_MYCCL|nr:hypothetical protein HMN09_00994400 [Mycena chlorophos]
MYSRMAMTAHDQCTGVEYRPNKSSLRGVVMTQSHVMIFTACSFLLTTTTWKDRTCFHRYCRAPTPSPSAFMAPSGVALHDKLPPELLVEIFSLCVDVDTTRYTSLPLAADDSWWTVLHTCSAWRATVLESMPELWANVSLVFADEQSLASLETTCEVYSTWLRYADSTATLAIQASCSRALANTLFDTSRIVDLAPLAQTVILPNASRFRKLDLSLPTETFLPIFTAPPTTFPQLEEAYLRAVLLWADYEEANSQGRPLQWPGDISAFCDSQTLRTIHFLIDIPPIDNVVEKLGSGIVQESITQLTDQEAAADADGPTGSPVLLLPWRTLRALKLSDSPRPWGFWYEALAQCRQLEHLDISVYHPGPGSESESEAQTTGTSKPIIELEYLTELQLAANGTAGVVLLSYLRAPALKALGLRGQFPIASVFSLHSRSDKLLALNTFLITFHISTSDAYAIFSAFPGLSTFGIFLASTEHFPDELWSGLTTGRLLPKLTELLISPRRAQIPALVRAMSQFWDSDRAESLEVIFHVLLPEDKEAMEEDLQPVDRFYQFGKKVTWLSY